MIHFKFDVKLFLYLSLGFIVATVIGTISHEGGHYVVAKCLGYDASIDYQSTHFHGKVMTTITHRILILLGGPLQTMLTGSIGLLLLFIYRKSYWAAEKLSFKQWVIVYLSLFWLRQLSNFSWHIIGYLRRGRFSHRSDENRLDFLLHLPQGTFISITAVLSAIVLIIVVFKFIPKVQRLTFLVSGLVGGLLGFYLWLYSLGALLMP